MIVRRWLPDCLRSAILGVALISITLASVWVWLSPAVAFYLAPLRAWELLIGAVLSQRYLPAIEGRVLRNLASLAGLLLVLVPSLVYTEQTPFPGLAALPPCVGAALIIAAGEVGTSLVGRFLSWYPVVFVGMISYSLYLWHWPILVFQRTNHMLLDAPKESSQAKLAVLAVSLLVATLSWSFIETPFRTGRLRPNRQTLFILSGSAFALVALMSAGIIASNGISSRFTGEALAVSRYLGFDPTVAYRENQCFLDIESNFSQYDHETCLKQGDTHKQLLLLGDSHGAQMYPGLSAVFPNVDISEATVAQCRPFVTPEAHSRTNCVKMAQYIYGDYLLHHHFDAVLLCGRWTEKEIPDLEHTVAWIKQHGMEVVVFGPNIEYDLPLPRIMALSLRDGKPSGVLSHQSIQPEILDQKLGPLVRYHWGAHYISIYEDLCSQGSASDRGQVQNKPLDCPMTTEAKVPLLFDTDHLTPEGSKSFATVIRERNQLPN